MFKEEILDKILRKVKKLIPKRVFDSLAPAYHATLSYAGALYYRFPSKSMKVIGVTGTKGKSTVVFLLSRILEGAGHDVAAIGSLGFKIKEKKWPNNLKMTMPGRFKLQKFMREAKNAGCEYVVLEVTSEGIKQKRHLGIDFDCAVFTNLHKEHLESHGSFENYAKAKQELFRRTGNIHVINADDDNMKLFADFSAKHKIFFGLNRGDMVAQNVEASAEKLSFEIYGTKFSLNFTGIFNAYNCLAALSAAAMYGVDLIDAKPSLESVKEIPGRMQFVQRNPFSVVIDYAHTPDSLKAVYKMLKKETLKTKSRLICVLGAAGGGRDKWKRPEFGKIAAEYCNEVILTNEDPYDEKPEEILKQISSGFSQIPNSFYEILDRREAIRKALTIVRDNDIVVVTGKGSETSMALAGGKKIPWSDAEVARKELSKP